MTDTLTFIHGGLYDGLDLNSKQNIRNLSLAEEDTSANKIYFACLQHINLKPENYRLLKNRKV